MGSRGRDRAKEAFWRRVIREQPKSGLSVRAWCVRHSVTEPSFYGWRRQLARRDEAFQTASFVPVQVTAEARGAEDPASRIEIMFPDARRVAIIGAVDRGALRDVLAVLASMDTAAESAAC